MTDRFSFGEAMDVSGEWLVLGQPLAENNAGRAFVYRRIGDAWSLHQELTSLASPSQGAQFGKAVAIASATDPVRGFEAFIAVGAPTQIIDGGFDSSGAVFLFEYAAAADEFVLDTTFQEPLDPIAISALDLDARNLGWSLDMDIDTSENTVDPIWELLVGSPLGRFAGASNGTGAAVIFRRSPDASVWEFNSYIGPSDGGELIRQNARFGSDVALDGDFAIVGAPDYRPPNFPMSQFGNSGGAFISSRGGLTAKWNEFAAALEIGDEDADKGSDIGRSVGVGKVFGGGYWFAAGDPADDDGGAVHVWLGLGPGATKQTIREPGAGTAFGSDVALVASPGLQVPDQLWVGAPRLFEEGAAIIYRFSGAASGFLRNDFVFSALSPDPLVQDQFALRLVTDGEQSFFYGSPNVPASQGSVFAVDFDFGRIFGGSAGSFEGGSIP